MYYQESEEKLIRKFMNYQRRWDATCMYVVGAHNFQEADTLLEVFPHLHTIVLFEPEPRHEDALKAVKKRLQQERDVIVRVSQQAVSDHIGAAILNVTNNDGASSSIHKFGEQHLQEHPDIVQSGKQEIQLVTLAMVQKRQNLPSPDVLIIDVEGHEVNVLLGMSSTMRRHLKFAMVESPSSDSFSNQCVYENLPDNGYIVRQFMEKSGLTWIDSEFVDEDHPTHRNQLFMRLFNGTNLP